MDTCTFDIETTSFAAVGSGILLCVVVKPLNQRPVVFRYDHLHCRPGHEKRLVKAVFDELRKYNLLIGHNIDGFDLPWLRSRAIQLGVDAHLQTFAFTYDTLKAFRRMGFKTFHNPKTGKPSAGLGHCVDFFGIEQKKTVVGMSREHWLTVWGSGTERQRAMDALVDHCLADVWMTEKLYSHLTHVDNVTPIRRLAWAS